jgi:hypothetical protein
MAAALSLLSVATQARAEVPVASYSTATCSIGNEWRVLYRLYFTDTEGRTTTRDATSEVLTNAKSFADAVGTDSACSLRMHIDVQDMGDTPWPAGKLRPDDIEAAIDRGGYDAAFVRHPLRNETYAGVTGISDLRHFVSAFPVDPAGLQVRCPDCDIDPTVGLMEHEWMHQVVAFYDPVQGWPTNDVHGGYEHGYCESATFCSQVYRGYFAAMLQGTVIDGGRPTGLLPADYLRDGRPAAPARAASPDWTYSFLAGQGSAPGRLEINVPASYDGAAVIEVYKGGQALRTASQRAGTFRLLADADGNYRVCVQLPGTQRFRTGKRWCTNDGFLEGPRCSLPIVAGQTVAQARAALVAAGCRLGQVRSRLMTWAERRHGKRPNRLEDFYVIAGKRYKWRSGSRLPLNSVVSLRRIRPACFVPALKGMTIMAARGALMRRGCRLGHVSRIRTGEGRPGRIVNQKLKAGATVKSKRRVDVVVRR